MIGSNRQILLIVAICLSVVLAGCTGWGTDGPVDDNDPELEESGDLEDTQSESADSGGDTTASNANTEDGGDGPNADTTDSDAVSNGDSTDSDNNGASDSEDSTKGEQDDPSSVRGGDSEDDSSSDGSDQGSSENTDSTSADSDGNETNSSSGSDIDSNIATDNSNPDIDSNSESNESSADDEESTDSGSISNSDNNEEDTDNASDDTPTDSESSDDSSSTTDDEQEQDSDDDLSEDGSDEERDYTEDGIGDNDNSPYQTTVLVTDAETGEPIEGATVNYPSGTAQTDANGAVEFEQGYGEYVVNVEADGYESRTKVFAVADGGSHEVPVELEPDNSASEMVEQTAVVTVVDGDGNPIEGKLVEAGAPEIEPTQKTYTDSNGEAVVTSVTSDPTDSTMLEVTVDDQTVTAHASVGNDSGPEIDVESD